MKILFLVYHGFSEHSGISKKINYQVKGLKENGYDVHLCYYDFSPEGHRCGWQAFVSVLTMIVSMIIVSRKVYN